jgi:hypothetical protein
LGRETQDSGESPGPDYFADGHTAEHRGTDGVVLVISDDAVAMLTSADIILITLLVEEFIVLLFLADEVWR